MALSISDGNRDTLKRIYNIYAKDELLSKKGLEEIFKMIDFKVTPEQWKDIVDNVFQKRDHINFEGFMRLFNIKIPDVTNVDIKNAFRLIAKDDDRYIPMETIKQILNEGGLKENDVLFIINQISQFTDKSNRVDYVAFLKHFSIM